jgi:hypothetical protein
VNIAATCDATDLERWGWGRGDFDEKLTAMIE